MSMRKSAAVTAQIKAGNKQFTQAVANGDMDGAAALFSSKAILMAPNAPAAKSKAKIKAYWQGAVKMGVKSIALRTAEVEYSGNTAIEVGNYRIAGAKNKTLDTGKYVVIWKKEGKNWKLHRDIFNSNQ